MSIAFLGLAWWGITLIVIASIIGLFLFVWGAIAFYTIISGTRFNPNKETKIEEGEVKGRKSLDKTIE